MFFKKFRSLVAGATIVAAAVAASPVQAESPFHTGVWQLNTPEGPMGLVISDWLIYDNGLPSRWLYRRAGTNDANQFDFYIRAMGTNGYGPVGIRVYRTGDNEMKYTVAEKGKDPVELTAKRLSIPNFEKSCLSVENKGGRLLGSWNGTKGSNLKKLKLSKTALVIDGKTTKVSAEPVRTGRIGIMQDGKPVAFLTDAGGDYAVLQWFNGDVTPEAMRDTKREVLNFRLEEIVRKPGGTCDREIKSRLATMKK